MLVKASKIIGNKEISNSLVTLFLRILGVLTLFVFTLFFNRNYSANIVGDYEFTRMFLLVAGGICIFGTDVSILYFSGRFKSENNFYRIKDLYYKVLKLSLLLCLCLGIIFYLFFSKEKVNMIFGDTNSYKIISTCLFFLIFNVWTLFNTEVLRALDQVVWSELFRNTFKFFPIIVGAFFLYHSNKQEAIIDFYIKGFVVLSLITSGFVIILLRKLEVTNEKLSKISYTEILRYSIPMCVSSVIIYLLSTIDIIILRSYYSSIEVAYYALGIKLMSVLGMIILSINVNISPRIAELYQNKDFDNLKILIRKSSWIIFILSLISGIGLILFSGHILPFFGNQYLVTQESLILLIIGQIIISSLGSVSIYLNMTGRPKIFRIILLLALIINVFLNLLLIPKYGILGASITYIITILFWNLSSTIYVLKTDGIKTFIH